MKEKILLFDMDGTLIDSTQAILESFLNTALFYGINLKGQEHRVKTLIGSPLRTMFLEVGVQQKELEECVQLYRCHYERVYLEKTFLLPKVKEALTILPKSYKKAIVTSKSYFFSVKILEYLGIQEEFYRIVGIDDVKEPKPSAEPILKALEGMKYDRSQVYMIGDTFFDMQAAKNANVIGIGIQGEYEKHLKKYTNLVFRDMMEVVEYILSAE